MIQTSVKKRRKLERFGPRIEEAVRSHTNGGWVDGLNPHEVQWLAHELLLAWNDLDLTDFFAADDRRRISAIVRRLERRR